MVVVVVAVRAGEAARKRKPISTPLISTLVVMIVLLSGLTDSNSIWKSARFALLWNGGLDGQNDGDDIASAGSGEHLIFSQDDQFTRRGIASKRVFGVEVGSRVWKQQEELQGFIVREFEQEEGEWDAGEFPSASGAYQQRIWARGDPAFAGFGPQLDAFAAEGFISRWTGGFQSDFSVAVFYQAFFQFFFSFKVSICT